MFAQSYRDGKKRFLPQYHTLALPGQSRLAPKKLKMCVNLFEDYFDSCVNGRLPVH